MRVVRLSIDMASKPGIFSDWPWKSIGSFKYAILAPWVVHSSYKFMAEEEESERDNFQALIFPVMVLFRIIHHQIWISLSRYMNAKGNNRVVDRSMEFDQVDRESNWDDQILMSALLFYGMNSSVYAGARNLPVLRTDGILLQVLIHIGPVEFIYYWFHRALHHHYLYSRYHSHHHASIVTQPISYVIHPFAEVMAYIALFGIPLLATVITGTASIVGTFGYIFFIDFMNNLGHCNFEFIPLKLFTLFPALKLLMYTPSYHSLHHTQFLKNYSLFMPIYDYIYNTMDASSDKLHEKSRLKKEDLPDVVHITHLTTLESIYQLPIGFTSLAAEPESSKWYIWLIWPITIWSLVVTRLMFTGSVVVERNTFGKLKSQTWVLPFFELQYSLRSQQSNTNDMIQDTILDADERGIKVLTLGLSNQGEELNNNGEIYIRKIPNLKVKVVDGSSLAVAVVLHSIPEGTTQVLFRGKLSKVGYTISLALCREGIQIVTVKEDEYDKLISKVPKKHKANIMYMASYRQKVWIVGDGLTKEEQENALKGTLVIPFSQFPPKNKRKDCIYYNTPSMICPPSLGNMVSCENWLPRKVMSAWRVSGIIHAIEGWNVHECGENVFDVDKVWEASLRHGFIPSSIRV